MPSSLHRAGTRETEEPYEWVKYMNKVIRGKRLAAIIIATFGLIFGSLSIATPAQAYTTHCTATGSNFAPCISNGYTAHGYENHYNDAPYGTGIGYWRAFPGHNCTQYVGYMLGLNGDSRHDTVMGYATQWDNTISAHPSWGYVINSTPAVGAIAQWEGNDSNPSASPGHVAYVESVNSNGSITISEDNAAPYNEFRWRTINSGEGSWPTRFLHIADVQAAAPTGVTDSSDVPVFDLSNGGLVAFARGSDNQFYNAWQSGPGSSWTPFNLVTSGNGMASSPAIYKDSSGTFSAFAVNTSGQIVTTWQSSVGSSWANWAALPSGPVGFVGTPTVYLTSTGGLVAYVKGTDNQLYNTWQTGPGTNWVTPVLVVGGTFTNQPTVVKESDGRFTAYAINSNGQPITTWQTSVGSSWVPWGALTTGGPALVGRLAVDLASTGGAVLFARGTDGALYHTWQTGPGTNWVPLAQVTSGNGVASSPTIYRSSNGAFTAFAINSSGELVTSWQSAAGSSWSSWTAIGGGGFTNGVRPTIKVASTGGLVAFVRASNGVLYNTWQTGPGTSWVTAQPVTTGTIAP